MPLVGIRVTGLAANLRFFQAFLRAIQRRGRVRGLIGIVDRASLNAVISRTLNAAQARAYNLAPIRTGRLRSSIRRVRNQLVAGAPYAQWVEYRRPFMGPAFRVVNRRLSRSRVRVQAQLRIPGYGLIVNQPVTVPAARVLRPTFIHNSRRLAIFLLNR